MERSVCTRRKVITTLRRWLRGLGNQSFSIWFLLLCINILRHILHYMIHSRFSLVDLSEQSVYSGRLTARRRSCASLGLRIARRRSLGPYVVGAARRSASWEPRAVDTAHRAVRRWRCAPPGPVGAEPCIAGAAGRGSRAWAGVSTR